VPYLDRDRWTQLRLAWLDAFIQYQLAGADLKRQTLYAFERGRSLLRIPSGSMSFSAHSKRPSMPPATVKISPLR